MAFNPILKITRSQWQMFIKDTSTLRQMELLLEVVNQLQEKVVELEDRIEALENP